MLKQDPQRLFLVELRKGVDILGETLAAIAQLAVWAGHGRVNIVDVAAQQDAAQHVVIETAVLLAEVVDGVEVGDLQGAKDIMRVLRDLGLQGAHLDEALADKDLLQKLTFRRKHHGLGTEIFIRGPLCQKLGHKVNVLTCRLRELLTRTWQDGGAYEDGFVRQPFDNLLHQPQILLPIVFGRDVNTDKDDIRCCQRVRIALGRV